MVNTNKMTNMNQKCIDECNTCEQACLKSIRLCLSEPDVQERSECIEMLKRCASISNQASYFISMDANEAKALCMLCAAICEKTASECDIFKDDGCAACADECKICANECRILAN